MLLGPAKRQVLPVRVSSKVWARLPGLRLVVGVVRDLDNRGPRPSLRSALALRQSVLRNAWTRNAWASNRPHEHPHLACWREIMREIGVKPGKKPASVEALVRRALGTSPVGPINPLVDLLNVISLRYLLPTGGWDLAVLSRQPALRFTDGGERFGALGGDSLESVEAGELAYVVGQRVITRHFVWRQSELGKITEDSRDALVVVEVPGARERNLAEQVRSTLQSHLETHFGVSAWTWILRE